MFLKFIFFSSLGDAVKSQYDLFPFLKTYPRIMPHFKKSLKVLIHILYMIGPSILRVSEGHFDSFMVWQVCLPYCLSFTMLCNAVFPTLLIVLYCDRRPVQKITDTIKAALNRMLVPVGNIKQNPAFNFISSRVELLNCLGDYRIIFVSPVALTITIKVTCLSLINKRALLTFRKTRY